jgi:release factor glutamine methyltransferase
MSIILGASMTNQHEKSTKENFKDYGNYYCNFPLEGILSGSNEWEKALSRDSEVDPYQRPDITDTFLELVAKNPLKYSVSILNLEFMVHPGVLSPKYEWGTQFQIETMPNPRSKTIIDMGCGTGAIALFCYQKGAKKCDAADISPQAVANTKENFNKYNVQGNVYESDLFDAIPNDIQYDIIHFNIPYHGFKPKDIVEMSITDDNYSTLRKFFKTSPDYLSKYGQICLQFSNYSDVSLINNLIQKNNLTIVDFYSHFQYFYTYLLVLKKQ